MLEEALQQGNGTCPRVHVWAGAQEEDGLVKKK